jgi:HAD superfamily phosphatase
MNNAIAVFDIDGVIRDVGGSYRRALADTVEHFTNSAYRPSPTEIDTLKSEGMWNNDWEAAQELIYRYYEARPNATALLDSPAAIWHDDTARGHIGIDYEKLVAFFQSRYRGPDSNHWTGYICQEPILVETAYLESLTAAGIGWGFFSGATRASATYILQKRLGLQDPVLVAMEDAPGKPDPTGLLQTIALLQAAPETPVVYIGDTVADMYTVQKARQLQPDRQWIAIGILPPHVQATDEQSLQYTYTLEQAGAAAVFWNVQELTPDKIQILVERSFES